MTQRFHHGDRVRIKRTSHWNAGAEALVNGSYFDLYDSNTPGDFRSYDLFVLGRGTCAWFDQDALEPISGAHGAKELHRLKLEFRSRVK